MSLSKRVSSHVVESDGQRALQPVRHVLALLRYAYSIRQLAKPQVQDRRRVEKTEKAGGKATKKNGDAVAAAETKGNE